jgi:hypothetical protein
LASREEVWRRGKKFGVEGRGLVAKGGVGSEKPVGSGGGRELTAKERVGVKERVGSGRCAREM